MSIVNKPLYDKVKKKADEIYKKPSAFKSGYIVQEYKRRGGEYKNNNDTKELKRWFKEKWMDINPNKTSTSYPVFRPTRKISSKTPLTVNEINKQNLKEQIELKQKIKGKKNLPAFKKK